MKLSLVLKTCKLEHRLLFNKLRNYHELIIVSLAVNHLGYHNLFLFFNFSEYLLCIVLKNTGGCVEILLIMDYLVDVLLFEVTDRKVYFV